MDIDRIIRGSKYPVAIAILAIGFIALGFYWFTPSAPSQRNSSESHGSNLGVKNSEGEAPESSATTSPSNRGQNASSFLQLSEYSAGLADKVLPGLVKIYVSKSSKTTIDKEFEGFFGQIPLAKNTDVGSGFFIRPDGFIITDYHVVKNSDSIRAEDSAGATWLARLHGHDAVSDLALLKVETKKHPHLEWGDSKKLRVGHFVWIAGSPFGLDSSLSFGIISSTERNAMNGSALRDYIQTDAAINPGSSGGPMIDIEGRVAGVASAILGEDYRGIGFVLPEHVANPVATQLIETGKVIRGWIGVRLGQVTAERARKSGLEGVKGAYVEWLEPGEEDVIPAKAAGLVTGDICIKCNGTTIESQYDLARRIAFAAPGELLQLEIRRLSETLKLVVRVAEKP